MRHFSSMCEAANLMIIILCLANLLISTNQLLDNDTTSLGDAAVDANVREFYLLQFFSLTFLFFCYSQLPVTYNQANVASLL